MRGAYCLFALASCGRLDFGVRTPGDGGGPDGRDATGVTCTDGAPAMRASVDSLANDWEPALSPDNQLLVFGSDRPGASHLYMAAAVAGGFGAPIAIAALNSATAEYGPSWNGDGTRLYFLSARAAGSPLYVSTYHGGEMFDPPTVQGFEIDPTQMEGTVVSADELELFFNDNNVDALSRLSYASRALVTDPWLIAGEIPELDEGFGDGWPTLSADGLTMMFETTRPNVGGTVTRIYQTHRSAIGATWDEPTAVSDIDPPNASDSNGDPDLSADGTSLVFSSTRAGGLGLDDIYVSARTCL